MQNHTDTPGTSPSRPGLDNTPENRLDAATQKAADRAKETARSMGETASAAADDLKDEAGKIAADATDQARRFAEQNKGKVAGQIESFGAALNKAADDLDSSDQAAIAGYVRQIAGGIEEVSTNIRDKGVEDLLGMVSSFARRQPAAFIGGAALLGFAASRFASSSAHHTHKSDAPSAGASRTAPVTGAQQTTVAGAPGTTASWARPDNQSATGPSYGKPQNASPLAGSKGGTI